jgi:hypothetical protein
MGRRRTVNHALDDLNSPLLAPLPLAAAPVAPDRGARPDLYNTRLDSMATVEIETRAVRPWRGYAVGELLGRHKLEFLQRHMPVFIWGPQLVSDKGPRCRGGERAFFFFFFFFFCCCFLNASA